MIPKTLPLKWESENLDKIVEIILGQSPPSSTYNDHGDGLPFFQGKLEFGDIHPTIIKWCCHPKKIANEGDVLLSIRAPVGATNVATQKCCIGRGLAALHPVAGMPSLFILYALRAFESKITEQSTGSTFGAITGDRLKKIELPLPPLPEQHRIVAKIEELFTQLDAGVASLKKAQVQLKRYRQAVLKAAFEGRLTQEWREEHKGEIEPADALVERINRARKKTVSGKFDENTLDTSSLHSLPGTWTWIKLDNIAHIKGGITKDSKRIVENGRLVPYLRVANVQNGYLDLSDMKVIEASESEIRDLSLMSGDILFTEGGDRDKLGRGWIWQNEIPECIYQNHIFRARLYLNEISSKYVSWFGNTHSQKYFMKKGKQTTNLASISLSQLRAFPVALPSITEQHAIVNEIERHFSQIDHLEQNITTSLSQAETLRQSILKQAFEGKLVPQDPNDEPASVLLERIKAEKASRAAEGKKGKTLQRRSPKRTIKNAD